MNGQSKEALVLFGSPHSNGHTKLVLNLLLENIVGYNFTIIDSYKESIKPCISCNLCKKSDKCIYNDFDNIDHMLKNADLLIIATPIYNLSFPAPLKAIFDRMQIYFSARFYRNLNPPIIKRKKGIILLTCGSSDEIGKNIILKQLKLIFSIINTYIYKVIVWNNTDKYTNISSHLKNEIITLAKKIE